MLASGAEGVYGQVVLNHESVYYSKRGGSLLLTLRILYDAHSKLYQRWYYSLSLIHI